MDTRAGLIAIGAFGFAAQIVLLRELFAIFSGNELAAGLMIGIWILWEALGALLGTRLKPGFTLMAAASVLLTIVTVALAPLVPGWFGLLPAETPTLATLLAVTALVSLLPAFSHGMLFTLGAHALSQNEPGSAVPANAYIWEGIGSTIGAAAVSFWLLGRLASLNLLALLGLPVAVVSTTRKAARTASMTAEALTAVCCLLVLLSGSSIERRVYSRIWQHQRVSGVFDSHYGRFLLLEQEDQRTVLASGAPVFTSTPTSVALTEELAHIPLLVHPEPERVLILGSSYAPALSAVLLHPIRQATVVQPDPVLNHLLLTTGDSTLKAALNDPRVRPITADPRAWLRSSTDSFDCIIITEPAPASLAANRLFSAEFYRFCSDHMTANGILAVPAPGSVNRLTADAAAVIATRQQTLQTAFLHVRLLLLDLPLLLAAGDSIRVSPETLGCRLRTRNLRPVVLDSNYIAALLDPFRQSQLSRWLPRKAAPVNRDLLPVELRLSMTRAGQLSAPLLARLYRWLGEQRLPTAAIMILLIALAALSAFCRSGRQLGIFTSGFAGAGLTTLLVYCYAVRFGSVYTRTALLIASFMAGSVAGSWLGRKFRGWLRNWFIAAELIMVIASAVLPLLASNGAALLFPLVAAVGGAAIGLQYAVACRLDRRADSAGTAGRLYTLDLLGGCLGGLLTAVIIVPVWGITGAGLLILLIKLASLLSQLLTTLVPAGSN
ncbi:MAG: hypothetical protein ABIK43_04290 [candidate division WOR-3 bacterium]